MCLIVVGFLIDFIGSFSPEMCNCGSRLQICLVRHSGSMTANNDNAQKQTTLLKTYKNVSNSGRMAAKPTTHKHKTAAELPPNLQHTNTKQRQNCRQTYKPGVTQTNDNTQNSGKTATIVSHKPMTCTRTKFMPFYSR
jgi:hypothetical protein